MASIILNPAGPLSVTEDGLTTATFDITLGDVPTGVVVLSLSSSDPSEVNVSDPTNPTIVFNATNSTIPQTVTLTGADDAEVDGDQTSTITIAVAFSEDATYDALPAATINVTTTDDEAAGFILSKTTALVGEDGTSDDFTVSLTSEPASDVVLTVSSDNTAEVTADTTPLTFTPENWSIPQTVSLDGVDDAIADGDQSSTITVSVDAASSDDAFDSLEDQTVTVTTTDDEPSEFSISKTTATVSEDGGTTDSFTLTLDTEPASDVVLKVTVADSGEVLASTSEVTLNSSNWDTGVEVTLSGVEDAMEDGDQSTTVSVSVDAANSDNDFDNAAAQDITVTTIDSMECFLTGTRILTDRGEVTVETLNIGDHVLTADGVSEPIKWVGHQTIDPSRVKYPMRGFPILIKAGALGHNRPHRDLYVSPDHAMFVEGLLINAGALVNGRSILKTEPTETFTYHHVELHRHSLLVAEGTAAESYLPQKEDRSWYDNGDEYTAMYPHGNILVYWPMNYARVSSQRQLPRFVSKHLDQRADALFEAYSAVV